MSPGRALRRIADTAAGILQDASAQMSDFHGAFVRGRLRGSGTAKQTRLSSQPPFEPRLKSTCAERGERRSDEMVIIGPLRFAQKALLQFVASIRAARYSDSSNGQ
jgi:hypothetical protein